MLYQNNVLIEGRLTKKPELAETKNGKKYSHVGLCFNNPKKLKEPNDKGYMYDLIPNFFNLTAWEKNAVMANEMEKGQNVTVTGKLMFDTWEDKEGKKRNSVYILVDSIKKIDMKRKTVSSQICSRNDSEYNDDDELSETETAFQNEDIPF